MRDTFIIRQDLSFKELCSSAFTIVAGGRLIKRYFIFLLAIIVISLLLGALAAPSSFSWEKLIGFILAPVFLMLIFSLGLLLSCLFFYRTKPMLFKNCTYRFNHSGVEKTGKGVLVTRPWSGFTKFRETSSFLFLYVSENDAHVIQKRMFSSSAELEAFKTFVRFYLPGTSAI